MRTELDQQAVEILNWTRRKLTLKLPELLAAIYLLPLKRGGEEDHLWTDGSFLYYHPAVVVQDYLERKDSLAAQLLHIIAHGLLLHIEKRRGQQPELFDAVADIKASAFVDRLPAALSPRRSAALREHLETWDKLTLEAAYLTPQSREEAALLVRDSRPLRMDDHSRWDIPSGRDGAGSAMAQQWQAAARQVACAMAQSGRGRLYGSLAGELCEEYGEIEESSVSYREFLRRFCSLRERQETDPNSISSIWYHVGLSLTGDAPFVEPEELREDAPALDLAVALDTSGSCCGDVMRGFLEELLAILRDAGGPRVELTLIQCDAEVQHVQTLTCEDTVQAILEGFSVHGCGGTDFRPVFQYIQEQNQGEEGKHFRGLLYLSDGCGDFPEQAPDYPVAFLFPREPELWDMDWNEIPDWVIQARITDDNRLIIHSEDC